MIFKDREGNILGGDTEYVDDIKAGNSTAFSMDLLDAEYMSDYYEIYFMNWGSETYDTIVEGKDVTIIDENTSENDKTVEADDTDGEENIEEEEKKEEESEKEEEPSEQPSQSEADGGNGGTSGVSESFKKQMDAYETFMDEYIDFMNSYDSSDPSMLKKYLSLLEEYNKYVRKVASINTDELSAADYAYYLEVTTRVLKKMSEISYN